MTTEIKRVFWTTAEKEMVALAASKSLVTGTHQFIGEALFQAQISLLPEHRRRPKPSLQSNIGELKKLGLKLMAEEYEKERRLEAELQLKEITEQKKPRPSLDLTEMIHQIVEDFEIQLTEKLIEATQRAHAKAKMKLHEIQRTIVEPEKSSKRVVVVGLKNHQLEEVNAEYGKKFELVTLNNECKPQQLSAVAKFADYVVFTTKFLSHSHQDAVRQHPGLKLVNGATSMVKDMLGKIAEEVNA